MTDYDTLTADMARLGERPYFEVGVPMFLIAQDLTTRQMPRATTRTAGELAERLGELAATLSDHCPNPETVDVARLMEVFADRHLLEIDGQNFTRISDS